MRIRLAFHSMSGSLTLPLSYHDILQGLLYRFLSDSEQRDIHDEEGFKYLVFSQLEGNYRVDSQSKTIQFTDEVYWSIGSLNPKVLVQIGTHSNGPVYPLGKNLITIDKAEIEPPPNIKESMKIRMISPVTVYRTLPDNETLYYPPKSSDFSDLINSNFIRKYRIVGAIKDLSPIIIKPIESIRKANILYKGFTIISYMGDFLISSKKEYLQFLYDTGLGDKNTQGFGMFKVI